MTSYTRQSSADIVTGNTIQASHFNNEFDQLEDAFNASTGHTHDGTAGEGAPIDLTASVTGTLPVANGGTNATTAAAARTSLGLVIGTNVQAYDAGLLSIAGLTTAADKMIYTTASDTYAVTALTSTARSLLDDTTTTAMRTTLGLGTMATQAASAVAITGGTMGSVAITAGTLDNAVIGGTTAAAITGTTLSLEDSTNQIVLDSDAANKGTITLATLASSRTYTLPDETGTIVTSSTAASTSSVGVVELATSAEINTGTDTGRAISPDSLAGSNYGLICVNFPSSTTKSTSSGDGWAYITLPSYINGMNLVAIEAFVATAGTTGTTDIQIHNVTDAADMLSTKLTIDSGEKTSQTAATPAVINTATDDVSTGDELRVDIDAISTTPAKGLVINLYFQLP